jgi:hypothetical protein
LQSCGLLGYFKLQNMRKEVLLLEYLIGLWDDVEKEFRIGPHMLKIELDDVYFLMELSRRGDPILLFGHRETPQPTVMIPSHYARIITVLVSFKNIFLVVVFRQTLC